jgi:hypothetical protein
MEAAPLPVYGQICSAAAQGYWTMDDSVQIRCHRCKSSFRDKARRVQSGYSRQCVSCETMLFFDDGSIDKNVQRTLREAKKLRRLLREAEDRPASKPFVFRRS